jgi:hypothetical protein
MSYLRPLWSRSVSLSCAKLVVLRAETACANMDREEPGAYQVDLDRVGGR